MHSEYNMTAVGSGCVSQTKRDVTPPMSNTKIHCATSSPTSQEPEVELYTTRSFRSAPSMRVGHELMQSSFDYNLPTTPMNNKAMHMTAVGKLFVGGLSHDTNDASLRKYFEKFGRLKEAMVLRDNYTMNSRGFGFVTYFDWQHAKQVLAYSNEFNNEHIVDGKAVEVKSAVPKGQMALQQQLQNQKQASLEYGTGSTNIHEERQQQGFLPYDTFSNFSFDQNAINMASNNSSRFNAQPKPSYGRASSLNRGMEKFQEQVGEVGLTTGRAVGPTRASSFGYGTGTGMLNDVRPAMSTFSNASTFDMFEGHNVANEFTEHSFAMRRPTYPEATKSQFRTPDMARTRSLNDFSTNSTQYFELDNFGHATLDDMYNNVIVKNKIFVGGLLYATGHESLRKYFELFGTVRSAEVIYNRDTKKSRGFGFVVFEDYYSVEQVLEKQRVDRLMVDGKQVEIKPCKAREDAVAEIITRRSEGFLGEINVSPLHGMTVNGNRTSVHDERDLYTQDNEDDYRQYFKPVNQYASKLQAPPGFESVRSVGRDYVFDNNAFDPKFTQHSSNNSKLSTWGSSDDGLTDVNVEAVWHASNKDKYFDKPDVNYHKVSNFLRPQRTRSSDVIGQRGLADSDNVLAAIQDLNLDIFATDFGQRTPLPFISEQEVDH